jgi:Vacuolar protein sorting-associated protein 26
LQLKPIFVFRYQVRVTIFQRLRTIVAEQDVVIHVTSSRPEVTRGVKTEIGIGENLRIELECDKWK